MYQLSHYCKYSHIFSTHILWIFFAIVKNEVQGNLETEEVFFWQWRGGKLAGPYPSLKTCRLKSVSTFQDRQSLGANISIKLLTIHPNPGPRDKTEEGKAGRRERRKKKRMEKKKKEEKTDWYDVITWNVQQMPLGTFNKRKARDVAQTATNNNWDAVLLSEVNAKQDG